MTKPTSKNVRQGQTVYHVDRHEEKVLDWIVVNGLSLIPEAIEIDDLREWLRDCGNQDFFFSRRRALSALKAH